MINDILAFFDPAIWLTQREGKSIIINKAIQDIGLGRYQWQLFSLCGMGWLADKYAISMTV